MNLLTGRTICYYCVATQLGGAERSLLALLKDLKTHEKLLHSWVLLPKSEGPLVQELSAAGIPFEVLPMPTLFMKLSRGAPFQSVLLGVVCIPGLILYFFKLLQLLRKRKMDLIHSTGLKCHYLAAGVRAVLGIPVLWHLRDILAEGLHLKFLRLVGRGLKVKKVANSLATAQAFSSEPIDVVYNGFDSGVYFPNPNSLLRERFHCAAGVPLIGIVGVLARWKGQLEFIEMAAQLKRSGRRAYFLIIGDSIYDTQGDQRYKAELKSKVVELGLEDCVYFTGFLKDAAQAINGLNLLVHASNRPEPFGRVIVEAFGCGVPVVASAAGGVMELIEDGKNGLLFPPGNTLEMTRAVSSVLDHPEKAKERVAQGKELFQKRFSLTAYREGMTRIYLAVLSAKL